MERNILYRSFEEYVTIRRERISDAAVDGLDGHPDGLRSYATKERKKVETMTKALGITLELFKPGGTYLMTLGCSQLFDCLLDGYDGDYGKAVRRNAFSEVPEAFLIRVRALLFDALRDAGISNDEIQKELRYFCSHTGCPQRMISKRLSEPVTEAIEHCRKNLDAPEQDWDIIADCLELQYLTEIKPSVMKLLTERIQLQFEVKQHVDQITERVLARNNTKNKK